jgi:hypothetical protein
MGEGGDMSETKYRRPAAASTTLAPSTYGSVIATDLIYTLTWYSSLFFSHRRHRGSPPLIEMLREEQVDWRCRVVKS